MKKSYVTKSVLGNPVVRSADLLDCSSSIASLQRKADLADCSARHSCASKNNQKMNVVQCMGQDKIEAQMGDLFGIYDAIKAYDGFCGGWSLLMLENPEKASEIWESFERYALKKKSVGVDQVETLKKVFMHVVDNQLRLLHADESDSVLSEQNGDAADLDDSALSKQDDENASLCDSSLKEQDDEDEDVLSLEEATKCLEKFASINGRYDDSKYFPFVSDCDEMLYFVRRRKKTKDESTNEEIYEEYPDKDEIDRKKKKFIKDYVLKRIFWGKWLLSTDCHYMSISFNESSEKNCLGYVAETNQTGIVPFKSMDHLLDILIKEDSWFDQEKWSNENLFCFKCYAKKICESESSKLPKDVLKRERKYAAKMKSIDRNKARNDKHDLIWG